MQTEILIKIIEIRDVGDCIAVTGNGKRIKIDPFVGCAWEWENKDALLNTVLVLSNDYQNNEGIYLPNENQLRFAGVEDCFQNCVQQSLSGSDDKSPSPKCSHEQPYGVKGSGEEMVIYCKKCGESV